jgi:ketosteroid isomerase-like protein
MEFRFAVPGTPAELRGRQAVIDSFSGYGDILDLEGMECENAYRTDKPGVIILQYKGNGVGVATGRPYNQSYISILTIADRKVIHWNDYWNPLVVMEAIGGSDALNLAMYSN